MRCLSLLLSVFFSSCAPAPAAAQDVRIIGRSQSEGAGFAVQWPASGFEARFNGSTFAATIEDEGDTSFDVEVDGASRVLNLEKGARPYALFQGAAGDHVITLTRRTGPNSGRTLFSALRSDGKIEPTPAPALRLMVIGDSISTGYGVGGADRDCGFSYATEIATEAAPVLTARTFGADLQVIAIDGFGLVKNYDGGTTTMRAASWRALPFGAVRWPADAWQPQAIMVNLGTNDFGANADGHAFAAAYADFLTELRAAYPEAYIFAAVGPMLTGEKLEAAHTAITAAIAARAESGENRLELLSFSLAETGRTYGCDWHPGRDTQAGMALALNSAITRALGWTPIQAAGAASGRP